MIATSLPICDISALRDGSARQQARAVLDLGAAARRTGLFMIVNHSVPDILTEQALAAARRFFALPAAEKERVSMDDAHPYHGYSRSEANRRGAAPPRDAEESFRFGRDLGPDDPEVAAGTPFVGFNRWPELPGFREPSLRYFKALNALAMQLQRAFALDLGMPPDFFGRFSDRPLTTLRLLRYPAQNALADEVRAGAAANHDWGIFTLLAHDAAGTLEVQGRDGRWVAVDAAAGGFVCAIGDCLMRWSNDRYTSRARRVVNSTDREHHALAFSADPNPDTLIACLPTCQDEDEAAKYAPISYADYQQQRYAATAVIAAV